jgi:hypothetical protein
MGRGCLVLLAGLGATAVMLGAALLVAGNSFDSGEPEVVSVGTEIPQIQSPGVILTETPSPSASATPAATSQVTSPGASSRGGATVGPTPASNRGATGPAAPRACSGEWSASLLRGEETMLSNGFTQADVIFDAPLDGTPQFELVGEPAIEAEQLLYAQADATDPNEWDLFIDRRGDAPFPTGTHELTLLITVVGETCEIPLTLIVE